MQWQPSYALGIDEIDQQHQKLLTHAAEIIGAIQQEQSWSDIYYLIEALRKFASFHFQFEEALMRMFGYPEHDDHARSHESFSPGWQLWSVRPSTTSWKTRSYRCSATG